MASPNKNADSLARLGVQGKVEDDQLKQAALPSNGRTILSLLLELVLNADRKGEVDIV
jgi:hypothetical protein